MLHDLLQLLKSNGVSKESLVLTAIGLILALISPPLTEVALRRFNRMEANFLGDTIPVGLGVAILLWAIPMLALDSYFFPNRGEERLLWIWCVLGFAVLGWIDDTWGDKKIKGLRGHFLALLKDGRVTTGLVKAVGGLILSGWLAFRLQQGNLLACIPSLFVIALSANAMNLFDLRPGRAGAVFLTLSGLTLCGVFAQAHEFFIPGLLYVFIPAVLVWERDSRAKGMLGDTGSNLLGGALGFALCLYAPLSGQLVALAILIVLHILAERQSISKLIDSNSLLTALDRMTGERRL